MSVLIKTNNGWCNTQSIHIKNVEGWREVKSSWVKSDMGWRKVYPHIFNLEIVVSEPRGPMVLNTELLNAGWNKKDTLNVNIVIEKNMHMAGLYIYNNKLSFLPLVPANSIIHIANHGVIQGAGGVDGDVATPELYNGQPGITLEFPVFILNTGSIIGGKSTRDGRDGECIIGNKYAKWQECGTLQGVII